MSRFPNFTDPACLSRLRAGLSALVLGTAVAAAMADDGAAPVVGQVLDFRTEVRIDGGESLAPSCVMAEVSVGGRALPPEAVKTQVLDRSAAGARIAVATVVPLDAALVAIQLHVGCPAPVVRRFLLVAERPAGAAVVPAAVAEPLAAAIAPPRSSAADYAPAAAPQDLAPSSVNDQRVEVAARQLIDDGRDAIAARLIVSREDIARHGDTSLTEVLRRVPGITVTGAQGRSGEVRMRGLGSGYTQFLINGEPVAAGFSLDSIAPALIERIEVARVSTVDVSAQGIAGTINIILKPAPRQSKRELKASVSAYSGRPSAQVDAQFGDRSGDLLYALGVGVAQKRDAWPDSYRQEGRDAAGNLDLVRVTDRRAFGRETSLSLTPRLSWQPGLGDRFGADGLFTHTRFKGDTFDERRPELGPEPQYRSDSLARSIQTTQAQLRINGFHQFANESSLEAKASANYFRRGSDARLLGFDALPRLVMDEHVDGHLVEQGLTAAGKYRLPYLSSHAAAFGWDGERSRRAEERVQQQTSPTGRPTANLDEDFTASVSKWALYAQDEWEVDDALSVYAGLRWAGLETRTTGAAAARTSRRYGFYSPVLQGLWKVPGRKGDQLRAGLSRSYRAPRLRDLIQRRYVANDNTPTTPDFEGNPELRPELAWGLDLGYEHYLPRDAGMFGISVTSRLVKDVILDRLFFDSASGAWVTSRVNNGRARVHGLDLESRLRLRAVWPQMPNAELRASLSRNWSRVDAVPGPDNRLDTQLPFSANFGLDWRFDGAPVTLGASYGFQDAMHARATATETNSAGIKRTLDLYGLWRWSPDVQWRLAVANALHQNYRTQDTHEDAAGSFLQQSDTPTRTTVRLTLELKL